MSDDAFWALVTAAVAAAGVVLQFFVWYFVYRKFKR